MAYGGPDAWALEVKWDGSTWVDESDRIAGQVSVTRGRASDADGPQPGVMAVALHNHDGRYTPDNPLSPLWPYVVDGVPCRLSVTRGGVTSTRILGRLSVAAPDLADLARGTVQVTVTDVLGDLARRVLAEDYVEQWRAIAASGRVVDLFTFDAGDAPARFDAAIGAGRGSVVPAASGAGSVAVTSSPEGIASGWSIDVGVTDGIGPVVVVGTTIGSGSVGEVTVAFRTPDRVPAGGAEKWVVSGLTKDGELTFSVRLVDVSGRTDLRVYDGSGLNGGFGALVGTLYQGWSSVGAERGDDQWFVLRVTHNAGSSNTTYRLVRVADGVVVGTLTAGLSGVEPIVWTSHLLLGARGRQLTPGKQYAGVNAKFAAAAFVNSGTVFAAATGQTPWLRTADPVASQARATTIAAYAGVTLAVTGTRSKTVARVPIAGRTAFDVLAQIARTVGAVMVADPTTQDRILWLDSDAVRGPDVELVADLEEDADAAGGLPMRKGEIPSRVTASWPGGTVTVDAEVPQLVTSDASVDTCAATAAGARDVAGMLVNASRSLRLVQVTVDVAGSANDLWADVMGLQVGDRVRVVAGTAGSPLVNAWGWNYAEAWVTGWTEVYGEGVASMVLDLVPADDPVEGVVDDATRGRCASSGATVTGGTAVGITGTGTIVVTTSTGPALSTAAGDYPMTLDWGGELVTITSAPASSSSPQTLTITTRGVARSVPRAHSSGEPIDVATPAAATI